MTLLSVNTNGQEFCMKTGGVLFVLALVAANVACQAQMPSIPFDTIQQESQPQLERASDLVVAAATNASSSNAIAPTAIVTTQRTPAIIPRMGTKSFVVLNAIHLGMALLDVGMSQRCISDQHCKEGNPLMPSSLGGQLGLSLGMFAYATGTSYYFKKHGSRWSWVPPAAGIGVHTVGVLSGISH
jgi:hypothetical protein